jgi:cell division transport system permease protein
MTPMQRAWRGAKNDWRLHVLSVFSVAVAFVCLAAALLIVVNVDQMRERWASTGRASVYLKSGSTREQAAAIEKALRASEGVIDVRFVSSEDARRELVGAGLDPILAAIPDDAFPPSLEVMVQGQGSSATLERLAAQLGSLAEIESVETYASLSDRLGALLTGGVSASLLLAAVVLAAVVSVVSSTIRLTLQRRKVEVEVLKLVGATDGYVRRPFVVEGAAQGALGATLAIALLAVLFSIVSSHFDASLAVLLGVKPAFLPWSWNLLLIAAGAVLGALAALGSLRRLLLV